MPTIGELALEAAIAGDRDAIAQLLGDAAPALREGIAGQIPARWRSVLSVDDVVQQTYVDAFLDIGRFIPQGPDGLVPWLMKIAKRNLLDAVRWLEAEKRGGARRRASAGNDVDSCVNLLTLLSSPGRTPSSDAARTEACRSLQRSIQNLPVIYQRVVQLYDLDGQSIEEVSEVLDRSPGAVFMLRARAIRRLNEMMGTASQYLSDAG
ncbi:MAG: RNA polymerase sigma factor [Planctomycetota bacterium]